MRGKIVFERCTKREKKVFTLVTNSVISSVLVTSSVSREVTVLTVVEARKKNKIFRSFVLKTTHASIFTFKISLQT